MVAATIVFVEINWNHFILFFCFFFFSKKNNHFWSGIKLMIFSNREICLAKEEEEEKIETFFTIIKQTKKSEILSKKILIYFWVWNDFFFPFYFWNKTHTHIYIYPKQFDYLFKRILYLKEKKITAIFFLFSLKDFDI